MYEEEVKELLRGLYHGRMLQVLLLVFEGPETQFTIRLRHEGQEWRSISASVHFFEGSVKKILEKSPALTRMNVAPFGFLMGIGCVEDYLSNKISWCPSGEIFYYGKSRGDPSSVFDEFLSLFLELDQNKLVNRCNIVLLPFV